jgi:ProP effector
MYSRPVPLKIGIFEDLVPCAQDLSLSEAELREAIGTWCRGTRYWACLIEGASRVDLAGQEAGHVRPVDAKRAQQLQARRAPQARFKPSKTS